MNCLSYFKSKLSIILCFKDETPLKIGNCCNNYVVLDYCVNKKGYYSKFKSKSINFFRKLSSFKI